LIEALLNDFRTAFPELHFELRLDFAIVNAQAIPLKDQRLVAIYGGLALHPKLGCQALTLVMLHEAGHHLAGGRRSSLNPSLACECNSDHWAITVGKERLLLKSGRRLRLRIALAELNRIMGPRQRSVIKYNQQRSRRDCWAKEWSCRRNALLKCAQPSLPEGHCITYV
jgi:hypothetical protein